MLLENNNTCIIDKYGDKKYYLNDKFHREDGPAVEHASGDKYWYINGKLHREDGPAIEYTNGDKYWFINGQRIYCEDNEEFLRIINLIEFM
jgi:hypothetical protein